MMLYTIKHISIKKYAFSDCSSLTSITIPNSVTSIGTFINCYNLENLYYDGTIEDWCNITFKDENSNPMSYANHFYIKNSNGEYEEVTEIVLPDTITEISERRFQNFTALKKITIPSSVTSIGKYAFSGCSNLLTIINNSDLELTIGSDDNGQIAYYAYKIINKDGSITYKYGYNYTYIETEDNFLFRYDSNNNYQLVAYLGTEDTVTLPEDINGNSYEIYKMEGVKNAIIPDTFTSIGDSAFSGCSSLTSIVIPNSVTIIGYQAFYDCSSLTSVIFEEGSTLASIEQNAFTGCSSLTSITIPNSVTSIGFQAFYNCGSLISMEIPNSVTSIGNFAFQYCISLTIYCEVSSEPDGWNSDWNSSNCKVVWDYKKDN